jgi:transketolase
MTDMRTAFVETTIECLDNDERTAVVLADISTDQFSAAASRHPSRVVNVGIREQLMMGVAGGLALTGLTPVVHSYVPFLLERTFEQVKLDLGHQGAKAILVSIGASYDDTGAGRTHHAPEDVALLDALPGWRVVVPGHADEVPGLLRDAFHQEESTYVRLSTQANAAARPAAATGELEVIRPGGGPLVVAVGPMLDAVLEATEALDVTVAYATTVRPLDAAGLRTLAPSGEVVLVEPYLAGTSARQVDEALLDRPHRTLSLGVGRVELRRYGSPAEHAAAYGLDPASLRRSITGFLG